MKAFELLSDETKWTKYSFARNSKNDMVEITDPTACKWCLVGAIQNCYPEFSDRMDIWDKIREAIHIPFAEPIIEWNDHPSRTFTEVHSLLKSLDL